jgi:hypothetical protein
MNSIEFIVATKLITRTKGAPSSAVFRRSSEEESVPLKLRVLEILTNPLVKSPKLFPPLVSANGAGLSVPDFVLRLGILLSKQP